MRKNEVSALKERLVSVTKQRQSQEKMLRESIKNKALLEIKTVNPDVNVEEVEKALEEGDTRLISKLLAGTSFSDNEKSILNLIEKKHTEIRKIDKTTSELHKVIYDLQCMNGGLYITHDKALSLEMGNQPSNKSNFDVESAILLAKGRRDKEVFLRALLILMVIIIMILLVLCVVAPTKVEE